MKLTFSLLSTLLLTSLAALHAAKPREITNSIGIRFVRIEPGEFRMGQDGPRADYQTVKHAEKCDDAGNGSVARASPRNCGISAKPRSPSAKAAACGW